MGTELATLYKALAKVQKAVLTAVKDGKNPAFNSKYATLAEVLATVRDPLAENGFALIQDADTDLERNTVGVVTRLLHESGAEIVSARLCAPLKKEYTKAGVELPPSVQQIGALVTYLRRYSLCAFLSVAVEDDDGNAASQIGKGPEDEARGHDALPSTKPNRVSAHTGKPLDSQAAVAEHKAAAAVAAQQGTDTSQGRAAPPEPKPPVQQPAQASPPPDVGGVAWPRSGELVAALNAAAMLPWQLDGYLRGSFGEPRIKKPVLQGSMTLDMLGAPIIQKLLVSENWNMIVQRVNADDSTPF